MHKAFSGLLVPDSNTSSTRPGTFGPLAGVTALALGRAGVQAAAGPPGLAASSIGNIRACGTCGSNHSVLCQTEQQEKWYGIGGRPSQLMIDY